MANVTTTRTYIDDLLKYVYGPMIVEQSPEQSLFMKKLDTLVPKLGHGGKSFNIAVQYDSKGAATSLGESDYLPASVPGNWDLTTIPFYWHYFTVCVSGQAMATSDDSNEAFAEAAAREIIIKQRAMNQMINRQMCSDGNGILCQVDGAVAGQVITVDNAGGWSGFNNSAVNGHKFISDNMYIQARDSSGTVHDAGLLITSYTPGAFPTTSATLTVSGTCSSVTDGDYVYQAASSTASNDAYGHEMPGIKLLIDDNTVAATVQSISATDYPEWRSQIGYGATHGTAEALTALRMMNLLSDIQINGAGQTSFIATSPGVWMTYGALADQNNTIMNSATYDLAYPTLNFNGIPVFQDPYLADEMYFVDPSTIAIYQALAPGWIEEGGSVLHQHRGNTGSKDEFEANWRWYMTLGISNRAKNGKMVDIGVIANKI